MHTQSKNAFLLYEKQGKRLNSSMMPDKADQEAITETSEVVTFDDLLVAVGKTQNRDAFIRLFEYFAPRVKSFLMRGSMKEEQADELAQETMLTVCHRADRYDPSKAKASTWIFTIARNKKIDLLRKNKRPQVDIDDPMFVNEDKNLVWADDAASNKQEGETLEEAVRTLPEDQADLIQKAYFEDKTHQEISDETGLPLGTVKSRLRLAMDKLRHNLKGMRP